MRFFLVASALIAAASVASAACGPSAGVCTGNQEISVPSNVVAWYATGVSDLSSTDNDLTLNNGVATGTDGNGCGDLVFTAASNQYASAPFDAAYPVGNAPRSLFLWVKGDSTQQPALNSDVNLVAYGALGSINQAFLLGKQNLGGVYTWFFSQWGDQVATSAPVVDDVWTHFGVTFDGTTATLYVNGVFSNSKPFNLATTSGPVLVGGTASNQRYFGGAINGVVLYNTALTAGDVSTLYANGPGSCVNNNSPFARCVALVHCVSDPSNAPANEGNTPAPSEYGFSRVQVAVIDTSSYNVNFDVLSSNADVTATAAVVDTADFEVTASATNFDCTFTYDGVEQEVGDTFDDCILVSRSKSLSGNN